MALWLFCHSRDKAKRALEVEPAHLRDVGKRKVLRVATWRGPGDGPTIGAHFPPRGISLRASGGVLFARSFEPPTKRVTAFADGRNSRARSPYPNRRGGSLNR